MRYVVPPSESKKTMTSPTVPGVVVSRGGW